ncbi:MAG: aldehyde dehydrogenase family protein [Chitinophagaceae bacterium]
MNSDNHLQEVDLATYQPFINGAFLKNNPDREFIEVFNPCTEELIARVPRGTQADADRAIAARKLAQQAWSKRTSLDRASYLKAMADVITKNRVLLASVLSKEIDMSSQINKTQLGKITRMVKSSVAEGAMVATGGKRNPDFSNGYYYEPTVLLGVEQHCEIIQREIFGPVLPVMQVKNFDEAISMSNDCEFGPTSSVYTNDINKVLKASKELHFGETYFNRGNFEAIQGFYAGWKKSGIVVRMENMVLRNTCKQK